MPAEMTVAARLYQLLERHGGTVEGVTQVDLARDLGNEPSARMIGHAVDELVRRGVARLLRAGRSYARLELIPASERGAVAASASWPFVTAAVAPAQRRAETWMPYGPETAAECRRLRQASGRTAQGLADAIGISKTMLERACSLGRIRREVMEKLRALPPIERRPRAVSVQRVAPRLSPVKTRAPAAASKAAPPKASAPPSSALAAPAPFHASPRVLPPAIAMVEPVGPRFRMAIEGQGGGRRCRWIAGDASHARVMGEKVYCGEPAEPGRDWCALHLPRVYARRKPGMEVCDAPF